MHAPVGTRPARAQRRTRGRRHGRTGALRDAPRRSWRSRMSPGGATTPRSADTGEPPGSAPVWRGRPLHLGGAALGRGRTQLEPVPTQRPSCTLLVPQELGSPLPRCTPADAAYDLTADGAPDRFLRRRSPRWTGGPRGARVPGRTTSSRRRWTCSPRLLGVSTTACAELGRSPVASGSGPRCASSARSADTGQGSSCAPSPTRVLRAGHAYARPARGGRARMTRPGTPRHNRTSTRASARFDRTGGERLAGTARRRSRARSQHGHPSAAGPPRSPAARGALESCAALYRDDFPPEVHDAARAAAGAPAFRRPTARPAPSRHPPGVARHLDQAVFIQAAGTGSRSYAIADVAALLAPASRGRGGPPAWRHVRTAPAHPAAPAELSGRSEPAAGRARPRRCGGWA
ncbi:hypothetical protein QJS66_08080 [Kocuria rhizophila]|nr:hypothetical protein QJS66_08080 [Kocuria rhizophila]